MIRINLLPVEMRRGNRLAARVIVAAFASALTVSASIGWFGLVWFGDLSRTERTLQEAEAKLAQKSKQAAYHDQLLANQKDYGERVQTIQDIGKSRRLWCKFLDELIDTINNNGETDRHLAWCGGLNVKTDPKKGATVTIPNCQVQGREKDRLANFHEDLEHAPFADDGMTKSDPGYVLDEAKDRVPTESLKFTLTMQLAPRKADEKKK